MSNIRPCWNDGKLLWQSFQVRSWSLPFNRCANIEMYVALMANAMVEIIFMQPGCMATMMFLLRRTLVRSVTIFNNVRQIILSRVYLELVERSKGSFHRSVILCSKRGSLS